MSCLWHAWACFSNHRVDIKVLLNECSNRTSITFSPCQLHFWAHHLNFSEKHRYAEHDTNYARSNNSLSVASLFCNKLMYYHDFIVLCITGWLESEPSHPFITPTGYWTWTRFCAHIYWYNTRFIIFWNKNTILKLFLYKTCRNFHVFNSRSNSFSLNNINTTCVLFPMYCWWTSVEC